VNGAARVLLVSRRMLAAVSNLISVEQRKDG